MLTINIKVLFIRSNMYLLRLMSLTRGSNLGPPGMAMLRALEVKKALRSNQIEVVVIHQVCEQLVSQSVEGGHHGEGELPATVRGTITNLKTQRDITTIIPNKCEMMYKA